MPLNTRGSALSAPGLALIFAPEALGQRYQFVTIDYPGAIATRVGGINDTGDMAGIIDLPGGTSRCFLLKRGEFILPEIPGATSTRCGTLNQNGDIGGGYTSADGREHGFILSGGRVTTIDYPGYEMTRVIGINNNLDAVGMEWNRTGDTNHRGFVYSGGRMTFVKHPESERMTCLFSINDEGEAVGHYADSAGNRHGVLWKNGKLTSFDLPAASQTMIDTGMITAAGDIVGPFSDLRGQAKGFILSKTGAVTRVEVPGAAQTLIFRSNNRGELVGYYIDAAGVQHGLLAKPVLPLSRVLTVDDDGADCPNSLRSIQEAVEQAPAGATILVCPGAYRRTVEIKGAAKSGLRLIANGKAGEVVLEGDYTEPNGFLLENVNHVLLRGFTVKDFGNKATTETQWGAGYNIALRNAHYNTVEDNTVVNGDMVGVFLSDSGNNVVRNNLAYVTNTGLSNCGMHIGGRGSARNLITQNLIVGNQMAGIMLAGAGADNVVSDNTLLSNGRHGITNQDTEGTRIEGNRVSYQGRMWGKTPYGAVAGVGIDVRTSTRVTVFDNRARNNSEVDVNWDGKGENQFTANACGRSSVAGICVQ